MSCILPSRRLHSEKLTVQEDLEAVKFRKDTREKRDPFIGETGQTSQESSQDVLSAPGAKFGRQSSGAESLPEVNEVRFCSFPFALRASMELL